MACRSRRSTAKATRAIVELDDLDLPGLNSVPRSYVGGVALPYELDPEVYPDLVIPPAAPLGTNTDDYNGLAYRPSALTYEPGPANLDADFANNVQFSAVYRTSDVTAVRDNAGAVVIRWQHPDVEDMNGSAIRSYTVTANGPASPTSCTWTTPAPGAPVPPLESAFTGLASPSTTSGTETTFSIVADNGKQSNIVTKGVTITRQASRPSTRPLAVAPTVRPTITSVTAHTTGVVVSFNPLTLAESGNTPVRQYQVSYRDPLGPATGTVGCTVTAPDHFDPISATPLSCVIPLTLVPPLQPYSFQVNATNYNGNASPISTTLGAWSAGSLTWAPNPADPLPSGPAATAWVPLHGAGAESRPRSSTSISARTTTTGSASARGRPLHSRRPGERDEGGPRTR